MEMAMNHKDIRNLDENIDEDFQFILGGHTYRMRYPNTEEIEESVKMTDKEKTEWMYSFIVADDASSPSIKDTLAKANIKKLQAFNKMIEEEFKS